MDNIELTILVASFCSYDVHQHVADRVVARPLPGVAVKDAGTGLGIRLKRPAGRARDDEPDVNWVRSAKCSGHVGGALALIQVLVITLEMMAFHL